MSGTLTFVPLIYARRTTLHPIQFGSKRDCRRIAKVMQMTGASVMRVHWYLIKLRSPRPKRGSGFSEPSYGIQRGGFGATVERAGDAI